MTRNRMNGIPNILNPGQVGLGSSRPESTRPGQVGLALDLDKYVAGPFSIYATGERELGRIFSPSEKQLS